MAVVICEKWFNSQLLEEIPKIPPQSLGQLSNWYKLASIRFLGYKQ